MITGKSFKCRFCDCVVQKNKKVKNAFTIIKYLHLEFNYWGTKNITRVRNCIKIVVLTHLTRIGLIQ